MDQAFGRVIYLKNIAVPSSLFTPSPHVSSVNSSGYVCCWDRRRLKHDGVGNDVADQASKGNGEGPNRD